MCDTIIKAFGFPSRIATVDKAKRHDCEIMHKNEVQKREDAHGNVRYKWLINVLSSRSKCSTEKQGRWTHESKKLACSLYPEYSMHPIASN